MKAKSVCWFVWFAGFVFVIAVGVNWLMHIIKDRASAPDAEVDSNGVACTAWDEGRDAIWTYIYADANELADVNDTRWGDKENAL